MWRLIGNARNVGPCLVLDAVRALRTRHYALSKAEWGYAAAGICCGERIGLRECGRQNHSPAALQIFHQPVNQAINFLFIFISCQLLLQNLLDFRFHAPLDIPRSFLGIIVESAKEAARVRVDSPQVQR
jgi:hypothetical protein